MGWKFRWRCVGVMPMRRCGRLERGLRVLGDTREELPRHRGLGPRRALTGLAFQGSLDRIRLWIALGCLSSERRAETSGPTSIK